MLNTHMLHMSIKAVRSFRRQALDRSSYFTRSSSVEWSLCCSDACGAVSRPPRFGRCARWSAVRRCVLVASLFVFFTLTTTLYTLPPSSVPADSDTPPLLLLPPAGPRRPSPGQSRSVPAPVLLATPDCDAIVAGDPAEIASTRRMLFLETRTLDAGRPPALNCSSAFQPLVDGARPLAYVISAGGSDLEQTGLLLRAVYAAANVYCLTIDVCSAAASDQHAAASAALRRLAACLTNVVTVDRCDAGGSGSRDRKWAKTGAGAWWRCVRRLLRRNARWTHVVSLTPGDFPLRPPDDFARRLANGDDFDVGQRSGNDVIRCGAYSRSAVDRPSSPLPTRDEAGKNSSTPPSEMHSPDGASALEVCASKCSILDDSDANNARCYYTVADLASLVRDQRKLFAHAFNLNVDHYAVRCLMQRIVKRTNE